MKNLKEIAEYYAKKCHTETNHYYNNGPYEVHLRMVVQVANKFIHLIPEDDRDNVIAGCWCHDVIEDTRQTYNDVKKETNEEVAELVYALTNEKGKNRVERGNDKYYLGIRTNPAAAFIKICDRIANVKYSKETGSRMFNMYKKENDKFCEQLDDSVHPDMVEYLCFLLDEI